MQGCGKNDIQLPKKQLAGKISGEDWNYQSANAYIFSSDLKYQLKFLSSKEAATDPCTVPNPALTHVRAILKPAEMSYSIAPTAATDNQVQVLFDISQGKSLTAVSGFMEIYAIDNRVIIGYLQAVLDDNNTIEGSFQARFCN